MRPVLTSYLVVAAVTAAVTLALVPLFRFIAKATGLLIEPDARRLHERATPILGGAAMYLGFVAGFAVAWVSGWFDTLFTGSTEPLAAIAGATLACLVGLIDDVRDISAPAKTAGMGLAAFALGMGGISIIWFRIPFLDVFVMPYDLALLFSVLWVLGMANAVNFIDGLDGLAAGIVGIGAAAFLLYGVRLGQVDLLFPGNIGPLLAALVLGMCVGFLPWNVYPAQIFMGDAGSLLLGTMMAASTMAVGGRTPDPFSGQTFFFYAPLAIPLLILGVPVLDTAFAIIRRATRRQGLATADKDHLHHRLVRLGHGHRRSVWILWAWTALLSAFVLYPTYNEGQGDGLVPFGVGTLGLLLYTGFHPGVRRGEGRSSIDGDSDGAENGTDKRDLQAAHPQADGPAPDSPRPHGPSADGAGPTVEVADISRRRAAQPSADRGAIGPLTTSRVAMPQDGCDRSGFGRSAEAERGRRAMTPKVARA